MTFREKKAIKYLPIVGSYLTYKKVMNYLKYRNDLENRKVVTSSYPPRVTFQASAYCNTNCRLCPVGLGIEGPHKGFLEPLKFHKVIDEAREFLITIAFADWGEPFLNPSIFNMIKYAEEKKIMTHASTNLHLFKNMDDLRKLLDCGLSFLTISLHGVSQETYEAYQPNKNFELTVEKIRTLISLKKQFKRKKPVIDLAFAITKKNEHEIEKMQWFAKKLGVDSTIYTASLNLRFYLNDSYAVARLVNEWAQDDKLDLCHNTEFGKQRLIELYAALMKEKEASLDELDRLELTSRHFCLDPWESLTVNWDGTVSLCCTDYGKYFMGDASKESIMRIWNNRRYRAVRKFLLGGLGSDADFPCKYCIKY
jgi:MoaA/NifB/PqqE/SkfB family radical SAM enzyme